MPDGRGAFLLMAEKYFDRNEAEDLLPLIRRCLKQARAFKRKAEALDGELARATARVMVLGGSIPPFGELVDKKAEREGWLAQLQEEINHIHQTGCLVKDLDEGIVDFPALRKGEEVYLCWKLGEERILYWHGLEEGSAGRKPLDESPSEEPEGPAQIQ